MASHRWFKPKPHGYGATPANWKGWAATLGFVAVMLGWSLGVIGKTPSRMVA